MPDAPTPRLRGFALMKARDPGRLAAIAAKGGSSVPSDRRSFSQSKELATSAGRKGGEASHGGGRRKQVKEG